MDYVPAKLEMTYWMSLSASHVALGFPSMFGLKTEKKKNQKKEKVVIYC